MAKKEKLQAVEPENPFMQKPTITDAVTYIIPASPMAQQGGDKQDNPNKAEVKAEAEE